MQSRRPFRIMAIISPSRPRRARRAARLTAAGALAIAGTMLAGAPAYADGGVGSFNQLNDIAVENGSAQLATITAGHGAFSTNLGILAGTSPSIAAIYSGPANDKGGYEVAFDDNVGQLYLYGPEESGNTGFSMMTGTSPSITDTTDGYEIAFQNSNGDLMTTGTDGTKNWGVLMDPLSSPSITAEPGGGYEVAYEANTNQLGLAGSAVTSPTTLGMAPGTDPSITSPTLSNPVTGAQPGGYEVAFNDNADQLYEYGTLAANGPTGLGMDPQSSPAITTLETGGIQLAWEANTDVLWTAGTYNSINLNVPNDTGLGMQPHTSPSIIGETNYEAVITGESKTVADDGFEIAFQANTHHLWTYSPLAVGDEDGDTGIVMNSESSPTVAPFLATLTP